MDRCSIYDGPPRGVSFVVFRSAKERPFAERKTTLTTPYLIYLDSVSATHARQAWTKAAAAVRGSRKNCSFWVRCQSQKTDRSPSAATVAMNWYESPWPTPLR